MSRSITITPAGRLLPSLDAEAAPELSASTAQTLEAAFAASSAEGLFCLAASALDEPMPAALVFWRELAARFFHALCGLGEEDWARAAKGNVADVLPPPADEELEERVAAAPPMRGLEYLTAELLRRLWRDLGELALARAAPFADAPEAFLRSIHPEALDHWRHWEQEYAEGIDFIHGMRLLAALDCPAGERVVSLLRRAGAAGGQGCGP